MSQAPTLDLVTIGRVSVDLYGREIGARLEDVATFAKAVGGCPANIAIGAARLGLKAALVSRVGDEAMGRFVREQLVREGVSVAGLATDASRLTALVLLGVRDDSRFPLIFYRSDCADAALDEGDIDEALIASAAATLVTGTHFALPAAAMAQTKAMRIARAHDRKIVFDIDYRPNLWGLAGHDAGEERYRASARVTERLRRVLPDCDLVVGTEEEFHVAGGDADTREALLAVRALAPTATLVLKRGPMGCVVFDGAIPDRLDDGIVGPGFPVEVYNVLGAGDAFMAGFLSGWLGGEPLARCATHANACGAVAVSRLLCSTEYPTRAELDHFLAHGASTRALRHDVALARIHRATTRARRAPTLGFLSIDHGARDLVAPLVARGIDPAFVPAFKRMAVEVVAKAADGQAGHGVFLDGGLGRDALFAAADHPLAIVRQFPQGNPEAFAANPSEWPVQQIVKLIANARVDALTPLDAHLADIRKIAAMCRADGRELLIEALPAAGESAGALIARLAGEGIAPDWWLVEPQADAEAWHALAAAATKADPWVAGLIVVLRALDGSDATFEPALAEPLVRGFVGGRAIFGPVFEAVATGLDMDAARQRLEERFATATRAFDRALARRGRTP